MLVDPCARSQTALLGCGSSNQGRDREGTGGADQTQAQSSDFATVLLMPELLRLTVPTPQTRAMREQRERRDEEDQRRAEAEQKQSKPEVSEQAAASLLATRPTQILTEAERKLAPGSQAAQRESAGEHADHAMQQRGELRRQAAEDAIRDGQRSGSSDRSGGKSTSAGSGREPARIEPAQRDVTGGSKSCAPDELVKSDATVDSARTTGARAPASPTPAIRTGVSPGVSESARIPGLADDRAAPPVRGPGTRVSVAEATSPVRPAAAASASAVAGAGKSLATSEARLVSPVSAAAAPPRQPGNKSASINRTPGRFDPADAGQDDANTEQIVRLVRSRIGQNRAEATLRLDPPELGIVRVHMDLQGDRLSLRIEPQTALAHHLLSDQMESLRHGLEAAGIQLEQVEIRPPTGGDTPAGTWPGFDTSQQASAGGSDQDQTGHANAEHSSSLGTESTPQLAPDVLARELIPEPATESRVNILA